MRRFTYDSLSRLVTAKNPETGTITYGYNLDSVLTSKTDARGITIAFNPDALHRITSKTYSDSEPTISYSYDAFTSGSNYGIGRRTGTSDNSGSTTWTYDPMGRVWIEQQTIGTIAKSTSNLYNLDSSVKQTTYPSGAVISVTPGGDGRPLSEADTTNGIIYAKSLVYAPAGQISTGIYGNVSGGYAGIAQINSYNSRGQPIHLQACGLSSCTDGTGSQTPFLLDLSYNYGLGVNDNGNVQGITNNKNTARSQSFIYDGLNRLLTAQSGSAWGINFTSGIDAWGNLFQTNTISGTATNPMSVNQGVSGKNQFTLMGYTYDAAGNVLSDGGGSYPCSGYTYTWNGEEQMTCAVGASYTYDGDGARVKKTGGSATATLYWGSVAESDTSGNLTSEYIFLGGRRIARRDVATGKVHYYFADALGSSNVVATAAGALENESDFYPFGGELAVTQNLSNQKYKFEGKERDPESSSLSQPQGLDNFGARFDSSSAGRFMSPDWANSPEPVPYAKLSNPQTLNLYTFAQNNPESAPDLDGHLVSLASLYTWTNRSQELEQGLAADEGDMIDQDLVAAQNRENKPPAQTATPQTQNGGQAQQQGGIGSISGYPETGANSWRAANDAVFTAAANGFDTANNLSPGDSLYVSPKQLKAQAMIESGGSPAAFGSDPLQVNVRGDFTADKAQVTGLTLGQAMTPKTSAEASLKWLQHKAEIHGANGNVTGHRSMHDALRNYNGNTRVYPNQGGLQHRDWYANQVLSLSQ